MTKEPNYLDHGYVHYVDHMGSDLSFTKAARASFAKDSTEWNDKEEKLLAFLIREEHFSVFRHAAVTFQVKAPLMVARQHWKYAVASNHTDDQLGWNESSRRYVTMEPEFYIPEPNEWRTAPENKKQGSGEPIKHVSDDDWIKLMREHEEGLHQTLDTYDYGNHWTELAYSNVQFSVAMYESAMKSGICAEQARMFLPAYAMYVSYQWTASVASLLHFLKERLDTHAQYEIRELAKLVYNIVSELYPATIKALNIDA